MTSLDERIGITDVSALTLWFRSRVGQHFTVKFERGAETAYVQYKPTKLCVIPYPNERMTKRDQVRLRGFGLHESSHPRYQPEIFDILETAQIQKGSPLGGIYNALLDLHAETKAANEYIGDAKALSEFAAVVGRDVYEKLEQSLKDAGNVWPPLFAKMASVMIAVRNAEMTWNVGMMIGFDKLVNTLYTREMRDGAEMIERKFHLTSRLVENCDNEDGHTIFELAKEIFEYLYEIPPETQMNQDGSDGKGTGKEGEGKKGKPKSAPEAGAAKETGSDSESGEGEEESLSEQLAKEKIKIDELLFSDHYETMQGGMGSGVGFDYSGYKYHYDYHPVDPASFKVIEYGRR